MQLDQIESRISGPDGRRGEALFNGIDLIGGEAVAVVLHLLMQLAHCGIASLGSHHRGDCGGKKRANAA